MYYSFTSTRRLSEINAMPDGTNRLGQLLNYFSNLMKDSKALAEHNDANRRGHQRALQIGVGVMERQTVTFENCLFISNSAGPEGPLTQDGLIYVAEVSNSVIIKNCIFENNDFSKPANGVSSDLMRLQFFCNTFFLFSVLMTSCLHFAIYRQMDTP
jgi:hypothetical protein